MLWSACRIPISARRSQPWWCVERGATITEIDIVTAARAELAGFKVPKTVFFVDALPRNSMGKVQKNVLRTDYGDTFR